jgi:hypothetical protein
LALLLEFALEEDGLQFVLLTPQVRGVVMSSVLASGTGN